MGDVMHQVTLEETGESFQCSEAESALKALARLGKRGIPVGCRGGGCGVCKVKVLSGEFSQTVMSRAHVSKEDEANQEVLACCIYPRSDVLLRVIGKLQRTVQR
jgi:ferredoxin